MNVKKELVKLIHYCTSCEECHDADIADHLIANGVTIQRWIPVTERLPEKKQSVLVYVGDDIGVDFIDDNGSWFWCDSDEQRLVTHWMPLSEPPKEVE